MENIPYITHTQMVVQGNPQAFNFLYLTYILFSPFEKSMIERRIQYLRYRSESLDNSYGCSKKEFNLEHVYNSIKLFTLMYNNIIVNKKNFYAKEGGYDYDEMMEIIF